MPEELVKGKIVFDTSGLKGALGGLGATDMSKGAIPKASGGIGLGKLAGGVALGVGLLKGIEKGFQTLVDASPRLQAQLAVFRKGMMLVLRPIADVVSVWLKPFLMRFLQFGMKFYQDYQSGGFWSAFKEALGGLGDMIFGEGSSFWDRLTTGLTIGATLVLAKVGIGALASALGLAGGVAAGGGLVIPASIVLGAIVLGQSLGYDSFETALMATIGIGAYALAGGGATGAFVAIPIVLAIAGLIWATDKLQEGLKSMAIDLGLINPNFDNGFTAEFMLEALVDPKKAKQRVEERKFLEDAPSKEEILATAEAKGSLSGGTGMISAASDAQIEAMREQQTWVDKLRETWGGFTGWIKKVFTIGESPAIFDYPEILATGFIDKLPPIVKTFNKVFKVGLIDEALVPSINMANMLYESIMQLDTTVTTTHIIKTVHEED